MENNDPDMEFIKSREIDWKQLDEALKKMYVQHVIISVKAESSLPCTMK